MANEAKIKGNLRYLYEEKDSDGNSILRYKGEDGQQHYVGQNQNAVTEITINGSTKSPTDGVIDLGTVSTPTEVISVSGVTPTQTLTPNTFYKFTGSPTSLSGITLTAPTDNSIVNIYAFSFTAGADDIDPIASLTGVEWANGFEPSLASGDYCEVTIMDGIATFISHTPAETT